MKIKKYWNLLLLSSCSTLPIVLAASCKDTNQNYNYNNFKNDYESPINNKAFTLFLDQKQIEKEIQEIKNLAKENKLLNRDNQVINEQINKIPQVLNFNLRQFTAEYLIARKLIKFKFNDDKLNQNIDYKYVANVERPEGVFLKLQIFWKDNPRYWKQTELLKLQDYFKIIRYGADHLHFSLENSEGQMISENILAIERAYKYNLTTKEEYKSDYDAFGA
ncbi:hypothetical protein [Mycoplasma sp. 1018B]|uniref:hypothetical protein n=1 Tax=Mycoplasma sp. 1018B TaxID=2967302 RepID=UPI00211BA118|nr:hypothetical protein [Mycoplasma sp. 1018B]UUM19477.1 hypothetical protein NPA14_01255 [Mycoplasma sp. 1018B]